MWGYELAGPGELRPSTVPAPDPAGLAPGDVLVRFEAGGLCGSDYPEFRDRLLPDYAARGELRPPLHEIVGTVAHTRSERLPVGTRVVGWVKDYHGLAELVTVADGQAVPVPAGMTPTDAVVAQPLACVLWALDRLGDLRGRAVAVLGLGPIGLIFCRVLADRGASVTGVDRLDRTTLATAMGAHRVVHAGARAWALDLRDGQRPDVVVEAVGHQPGTVNDAIRAVRPGGTVFAFGINDDPYYPVDMLRMVRKRLTLMAGITEDHTRHLDAALAFLDRCPDLTGLVSDVFPVADAQSAYRAAIAPTGTRGKVVITA